MSNQYKDEQAFLRVIRRCIKKEWFRLKINDYQRGVSYKIRITDIRKIKEEENE